MSKQVEDKLDKIPILNLVVKFFKNIKLPGFEGLSIYDLLEMYTVGIVKGALTTRASAIAFSFFTAIFPFLIFMLIVIPYVPIEGFHDDFAVFLESFLPPQTSEFFFKNIFDDIENTNRGGLIPSVLLLSILLMANGVNAVFSGFEYSYHSKSNRSIIRQYLYAIGVALILSLLVIVTIVVMGYFEIYVIQNLESHGLIEENQGQIGLQIAKYLFLTMMVLLATSTLYYFGTQEGKHSSFFSIGALFTTFLIVVSSYLFGLYIENFSKYNELYGSIGGLLILLFSLWLNANILLLGYDLNASLQRLREKCS